jgi:glycosyltransferase involved in cell wall biosynthesis
MTARKPLTYSIVTVCLNCRNALATTLASVFEQTYPHVESIVIDGGSRDGTAEYLASLRAALAFSVSEPDAGIYDAMNKGMRAATGDYILFLNAGDRLLRADVLERLAADEVVAAGASPIVSGRVQYEFDGELVDMYRPETVGPEGPGLPHQATFISTELQQAHAFDANLRFVGDYELWRRLQKLGLFKVHYVDLTIATFAQGGASTTLANDFPRYLERAYVDGRYGARFGVPQWLRLGATVLARRLVTCAFGSRFRLAALRWLKRLAN